MTARQIKMETCSHYRATLQKPGYQHYFNYKDRIETIKGKYKCPDCSFWWIDEEEKQI